jgi:hypothetical protein
MLPSGPILYPGFPVEDQQLFTRAILQACDALDGNTDGVIDDLRGAIRNSIPPHMCSPIQANVA